MEALDKYDRNILHHLQIDGRLTHAKLGERVHLSTTAVYARVQRLVREGFIEGYSVRVNPQKLGFGMLIFVEVSLDHSSTQTFDSFKAAVMAQAEVMECHLVAGGFDYLLKIRVADMEAYRIFSTKVLWQLPGIRVTHTYAVIEEVKHTNRIPS